MITTVNLSYSVSGQTITPVQESPYLLASNTVKYVNAQFALDENWASCDSVNAVWSGINSRIVTLLDSDGICYVPHELLAKQQKVYVNLTGSDFEEDTLIDRITTYPLYALNVNATAYTDGSETAPITPSQFEQFVEAVKDEVGKIKDIDSVELNADYTLTISFSDGTETTVGPIRGEQGETGNGIASAVLNDDYTLTLTFTNGTSYTTPSIRGEQGEQGEPGEVTLAQLSAVLPTDTASGAIASFPDGSDLFNYLSCVVNIDPLQDLHGYDKPWVGGAGANKLDEQWELGDLSGDAGQPQPSTTKIRSKNFCACLPNTSYYKACVSNTYVFWYDDTFTHISHTNSVVNTVITSPANAAYIKVVVNTATYNNDVAINYPSTVTTYSPYSNICPITGWTGCEVDVSGKNLFDGTLQNGYWDTSNGTFVASSGWRATNKIRCKPNTTYVMSGTSYSSGSYNGSVVFWDSNGIYLGYRGTGANFTSYPNSEYMALYLGVSYITDSMQIEEGSSASAYEPYTGTTYPVSWQTEAGTVYGGTVDVVTGVLTVTKKYAVINEPNSWVASTETTDFRYTHNFMDRKTFSTSTEGFICSCFPVGNGDNNVRWRGASDVTFGIISSSLTLEQVKTLTESGDFVICYELATPTTYQLTPTQIHALLGQNNVWADCGDTSVTYKADVQRWVEKMLGQ